MTVNIKKGKMVFMKKDLRIKVIYIFLIIVIVLSIIYIAKFFLMRQEAIEESELLNSIEIEENSKEVQTEMEGNDVGRENQEEKQAEKQEDEEENSNRVTERMLKVEKLQEENEDIVGWIEIEDTNINYPVLQGEDNEYYLTHNYKKEKTEKGSIFLSAEYEWSVPSNNFLIYGHNILYGQMFQDLLKYEEKDFYEAHPIIRFTTEQEDMEFEIISVFKSRVFYKSEKNVFRYYNFINAQTEAEYMEFINNTKDASLYAIDTTAEYGDQLITLITCSYHEKDGRFVVIGRKKDYHRLKIF